MTCSRTLAIAKPTDTAGDIGFINLRDPAKQQPLFLCCA